MDLRAGLGLDKIHITYVCNMSSGMAAAWSATKRVGSLGAARVRIIKKL